MGDFGKCEYVRDAGVRFTLNAVLVSGTDLGGV